MTGNDEIKYKLRKLSRDTIKEVYSRKYEQKKYNNVLKKLMSNDKFVDGLQLIQGQITYPTTNTPPTTNPPTPKPHQQQQHPMFNAILFITTKSY